MVELPQGHTSLLVRTDFGDDESWRLLCQAAAAESHEGFTANFIEVNDPDWAEADWAALRSQASSQTSVLFIADRVALSSPEHPILVIDLNENRPPFRCIPSELWGVENNLNISNMDWDDFASETDPDGVFRGFRGPGDPPPPGLTEQRGLAAAQRILDDIERRPGCRSISGNRDSTSADREIVGLPARCFDLASRTSFWMTHAAVAYPIQVGGQFQITSDSDSLRSRMGMFGSGRVGGEYIQLAYPTTVELTWHWYPAPRPGVESEDLRPFLPWSTSVVWTIQALRPGTTAVLVEHRDAPVEWVEDLRLFWRWNLEYLQTLIAAE